MLSHYLVLGGKLQASSAIKPLAAALSVNSELLICMGAPSAAALKDLF